MRLLFQCCVAANIIAGTACLFAGNYMGVLLNFGLAVWNTGILEFLGGKDETNR